MMADAPGDAPQGRPWRRASAGLVSAGGLLGLSGVAVSAAAAHAGGGSLGQTAGTFLLLHAAAVLALAALVRSLARPAVPAVAGLLLTVGVILFSGDLVLAGVWGWRPVPAAAPIGGGLLMAGWIVVAGSGVLASRGA